MMEIRITAYYFTDLNEDLQFQIMENVAGKFLRDYMDGKIQNNDLNEKIRKAVEADNYILIKHGIMDLAHDHVEDECMDGMYLKDGTRVI